MLKIGLGGAPSPRRPHTKQVLAMTIRITTAQCLPHSRGSKVGCPWLLCLSSCPAPVLAEWGQGRESTSPPPHPNATATAISPRSHPGHLHQHHCSQVLLPVLSMAVSSAI